MRKHACILGGGSSERGLYAGPNRRRVAFGSTSGFGGWLPLALFTRLRWDCISIFCF